MYARGTDSCCMWCLLHVVLAACGACCMWCLLLTPVGVIFRSSSCKGDGRIPLAIWPLLYAELSEFSTSLPSLVGRNELRPRAAPMSLWVSLLLCPEAVWNMPESKVRAPGADSRRRADGDPREPLGLRLYAVTSVMLIQHAGTPVMLDRAFLKPVVLEVLK